MDKPTKMSFFDKPQGLSPKGEAAHAAIMTFLLKKELCSSGGCKVFYSPEEWAARGEEYGTRSELIVVYDGGDHRCAFNMDCECYKTIEALQEELHKIGCFFEEATCWYGSVYKM
jgi:hypothetical protein